jgi:alpha-mannosidase
MTTSKKLIFHLLPNAHLDPVWLWDWREGLNEGRITVRTILDLMDEFPDLTFIRGESIIYEHIQKSDPALFRRILRSIEKGRWDVVGGTVIQPDTNLATTETICREFERGLDYFQKNLGVRPTVAWQADSFGHTPGFPNILEAFGMDGFAFTRPQQAQFPLDSPAFWWEGAGTSRILCYRQYWLWYCSERGNVADVLDDTLCKARTGDVMNTGVLLGLGNHGGGPTRRHLRVIEEWRRRHPEVEVQFSTLHGFFGALREEVAGLDKEKVPTVRGELGYCLRGCYSSVQKFKSLFRKAETLVATAEITRSVIGAATEIPVPDLTEAWQALVFNAFHDILPGSSIERAFDDQMAWIGLAWHRAQEANFTALNSLAEKIDATVPPARGPDLPTDVPLLIWNPLPHAYKGQVELEASLDYRPIDAYRNRPSELPVVVFNSEGKPAAFQTIQTEHTSMQDLAWRKRVLVPVEIPALGWEVFRLGWRDENEELPFEAICQARTSEHAAEIANTEWSVCVRDGLLRILRNGGNFFSKGSFEVRVYEDPWGSWGGMEEEQGSFILDKASETWALAEHEIMESGPLRAKLWTRWKGKNSWLDLTFSVSDAPWINIEGRMLWNERSARVKFAMPCVGELKYDVPGGSTVRDTQGHVPGGRWVTRTSGNRIVGFASDVLSDFDATSTELRVTLARASRYANDVKTGRTEKMWEPATDCGELKFRFCLFAEDAHPDTVADALLFPPVSLTIPATPGPWERKGSLANLSPCSMRMLSLEQIKPDLLCLRIQNRAPAETEAVIQIGKSRIKLGPLPPEAIRNFSLEKSEGGQWKLKVEEASGDYKTPERLAPVGTRAESSIATLELA